MKKSLAVIGVSSLFLGGCGEKAPTKHTSNQQINPPAASTQPNSKQPPFEVYRGRSRIPADVLRKMGKDPTLAALNKYRDRIYEKRRATVLLGACATWPNLGGGFTATVNPGTVDFNIERTTKASFFTFSAYNLNDQSWQIMNGPTSINDPASKIIGNDRDLAIELYRKDHSAETKSVKLTDQPTVDREGRVYFEDKQTGQPVIMTGYALTADYSEANIHAACQALREHKPLPGVLSS